MSFRPIFFDTETTGTFPERDRIIELAAFDPTKDRSFQRLIHPGIPIPKDAIAIHEITDEMVKDAPSFETVAKEFIEFCDGDVALIAHNGDSFDLPFLRKELSRVNLELPPHWIYIDSLKWARKYRKDLPRHSLQYLRQTFKIKQNKAHRALNDSMILAEVFSCMVDDLTISQIYSCLKKGAAPIPSKEASIPNKNDTLQALTLFG